MIPPWLPLARSFIGTSEIPGPKHNSKIVQWWADIKAKIRDDETPYCAAFVGAMLERCGIQSSRSAAARSYLLWGVPVLDPFPGCIVVFSRPGCSWCGHVAFFEGFDPSGNVMALGANQANTVSVKPFAAARVLGYRSPSFSHSGQYARPAPVLASTGQVSSQEA